MDSNTSGFKALTILYLQIEYGDSPAAILGVSDEAPEVEVRDTYRTLVLRIHPDKAPTDSVRELHTSLFQKVHAAYESLLKDKYGLSGHDEEEDSAPKPLPETLDALHARNVEFREALRRERERALKAKQTSDALKAAKEAKIQAKNARLAQKRHLRAQSLEHGQASREHAGEKRREQTFKRQVLTAISNGHPQTLKEVRADAPPPIEDWEQEEARLEEWEREEVGLDDDEESSLPKFVPKRGAPKNKEHTSKTARPMWDDALDERLVCDAEIKGRWDKNLLSGGRSGSVSLAQKKQRQNGGAARLHKVTMAISDDVDHMLKPALTGNRTFSGTEMEEAMFKAFIEADNKAQAWTDRQLGLMDGDVLDQHLVEYGEQEKSMALASFSDW